MRRRPTAMGVQASHKGFHVVSTKCLLLAIYLLAVTLCIPAQGRSMGGQGRVSTLWRQPPRLKQPFLSSSFNKVPKSRGALSIQNDEADQSDDALSRDSFDRLRGGQQRPSSSSFNTLNKSVEIVASILNTCARTVLPVIVGCVRAVVVFYSALPTDAILAQAGLVYCFAGGYYPTLFSALQAAQHCGWQTMVNALGGLTEEASKALEATARQAPSTSDMTARQVFTQKTNIVLKTIDPMKINQATGALYTTWMGVSSVLEREFAKTITLSLTMAGYLESVAQFILAPPLYLCVPDDYSQWVPVVIGWGCKAAAMNVAWRIQRVLTATTSAFTGGLMFSRALARMMYKRGFTCFGLIRENEEESALDEIVGFLVAGVGLYSQLGNGLNFEVPFPLSLVTWPFDWAERIIEWKITKEAS